MCELRGKNRSIKMGLNKEEKSLLQKNKITYNMAVLSLAACEIQINKYAYLSKKWNNYLKELPEGNNYEYQKEEWMKKRAVIREMVKENFNKERVILDVKESKDKASIADVNKIVALIKRNELNVVSDSGQ